MKLYNKYRAKEIDDLVGNMPFLQKIKKDIKENTIDHTYLFFGTHGVSKTTVARIIASHIPNCYVEEINASVENGVDTIKEISRNASSIPIGFRAKLIILDEIQKLSSSGFHAMLKVTEDCPDNVYFIIATTELNKIPANVQSRFTKIKFEAPDEKSMISFLEDIVAKENLPVHYPVIKAICKKNKNNPRDCLSDLQLVSSFTKESDQLYMLEDKTDESSKGYEIAKLLGKNTWNKVKAILKDVDNSEVEGIRRTVLAYHTTSLLGGNENSALVLDSFTKEMYDVPKASLVLACYENCK